MVQLNGSVSSKVFAAIVGPLVAVLIALGGLLIGRETMAKEVRHDLVSHKAAPCHPVSCERYESLQELVYYRLDDIDSRLLRIEEKLDAR